MNILSIHDHSAEPGAATATTGTICLGREYDAAARLRAPDPPRVAAWTARSAGQATRHASRPPTAAGPPDAARLARAAGSTGVSRSPPAAGFPDPGGTAAAGCL